MTETPQIVKRSRPIGVWILSIYALIFVGIVPLLLLVFMLVSGNLVVSEFSIILALPISIGAILSSIGAWKGNEKARKSLLVFIALHYGLIAINNYILISSGQVSTNEQIKLWGRVLRGFIYPAIYIWYFNRHTTQEFYD